MIAADTSTWIAYFQGERAKDTDQLDQALAGKQVVMVPVVLTELLSDPNLDNDVAAILAELPLMQVQDGFWERAGRLRAGVLASGRKARLGDALIAQTCLDHDLPLITRDRDFLALAAASELRILIVPPIKGT